MVINYCNTALLTDLLYAAESLRSYYISPIVRLFPYVALIINPLLRRCYFLSVGFISFLVELNVGLVLSRDRTTTDGVWTGNRIYWTL
jgi:hypothetical protein